MWRRVLWQGMVGGLIGAGAMTVGEKVEQRLTGRPSSHVPGATLGRLLGVPDEAAQRSTAINLGMHFGQAAALGVVRSLMSQVGLRGPVASVKFGVIRLTNDQILENATGVGAPPQTWPRPELAVDLLHKGVYAFTTGLVTDALAGREGPGPGQRHAGLRRGRVGDVGPVPRDAAYSK